MDGDALTTRRLVLIRLLFARAEEQANQSRPYSTDSVNRLHDVAEMFLALAAERHQTRIPTDFMSYWTVLEEALGRRLLYRAQMQKLNKVRVNLKHYGIEPTSDQIFEAVAAVRGLLEDECRALLGQDFDDVSLFDVVNVPDTRDLLESAERKWEHGHEADAFADLADAFNTLVMDYRNRKQLWHRRSVFDNTLDMTFLTPFHRRVEDRGQEAFDNAVIESLKNLDFNVMLVGLGIDLRRYGRFKALTPKIRRAVDGSRIVTERLGVVRQSADYEFCREFVVSTAIHLSEFDYEFDFWTEDQREIAAESAEEE